MKIKTEIIGLINNIKTYCSFEILILGLIFYIVAVGTTISSNGDVAMLLNGLYFFNKIILYLFATTFLKNCIINSGFMSSVIHENQIDYNLSQEKVYSYCFLTSFSCGLATPFLFKSINPNASYTWLSRWTCLSMFFVPTTIASFIVFETLPVNIGGILLHTFPLFFIFYWAFPLKLVFNNIIRVLMLLASCNIAILWYCSTILKISLLLTQSVIFIGISCFMILYYERNFDKIVIIIKKSILESINNTVFFIGLGILTLSLQNYSHIHTVINSLIFTNITYYIGLILVILPLITICFVHPLVLYSLLHNSINIHLIERLGVYNTYVLWVCMFIVAQLCSPASVSSILSAHAEQVSIFKISILRHWKFCIILILLVIIYITILILAKLFIGK